MAAVVLTAFAVFGCGGDTPTQPALPVVVAVNPTALSVQVGSGGRLFASATRNGSPVTTETFTFTSDKPTIATVSPVGTVIGVAVGTATVTVTGSSGTTATAAITVTASPPALIEKTAGDAQAAIIGSAVPIAPSVTVKDASGKPVAGVAVTFAPILGGGTVTGGNQTTNASGVATVGSWVLGSTGFNTLSVTVGSLTPITFVATGQGKPGAIVLASSTASFSATAGAANPASQTVSVTASGGPTGALSLGTVTYGSGASNWLSAVISSPDAPALVVLAPNITGLAAGTYTATVPVRSAAASNSPQNITVTLTVDPAPVVTQTIAITTQPGGAASGALLNPQPVVVVRDGAGAVDVNFTGVITATLNGTGGVLSGTVSVTASGGVASFTDLKVTNNGRYSLSFSTPVIGTVTSNQFLIGNAPPTPSGIVLNIGAAPTANVAVGANAAIPIIADMSAAQGSLASLTFTFTWDPALFDFVSTANGTFGGAPAYFVNNTNSANGSVTVSVFDVNGLTAASGTPTIFTVTLKGKASSPSTVVTANVTASGDASGLALPAGALTVRPLTVTIP